MYSPLNIVRANIHDDLLVLEDNLVVERDVAHHIVCVRKTLLGTQDRDFGKTSLEIVLCQLSDHGQAFAAGACSSI